VVFPEATSKTQSEAGRATGLLWKLWAPLLWSAAAFLLRVIPSWRNVFSPDGVRFQLVDSWYHLRSIEFFALNFPHRLHHDPLAFYPGGSETTWPPLFDFLVGAIAWLTAGGALSSEHIETVAALAPPTFGAATVFVIYRVALRLFGTRAAQLAACFAAVLPGPFLVRSSLGFSDHHSFEVLLATVLLAALLGAIDTGRPWKAGLALSLYLLAWNGASLSVVILGVWAALQIVAVEDRAASWRLTQTVLSIFGLAAGAVLFFWTLLPQAALALGSLAGCSVFVMLAFLLRHGAQGRPSAGTMSGGLVLLAGSALGAIWLLAPELWTESLGRLMPSGAELSVSEMRPLLLGFDGQLSLAPAWTVLGPMFFLFLVAWLGFAFETWSRPTAERTLLLIWSGSLLALTLLQFRFAASLGPSCAIIAAWGASCFLQFVEGGSVTHPRRPKRRLAAAWLVILLLAIYPSSLMALRQGETDRGPSKAWWEGLDWLRHESPKLASPPQYGVLAWWDYGSLITYRARRAPMANGSGLGIRSMAEVLTEDDLAAAKEQVLASGAQYVVVDEEMILRRTRSSPRALQGKILGALQWAGKPLEDFVEIADQVREDGRRIATPLYSPKYFQSLATRLFLYGGEAAEPQVIWVVRLTTEGPAQRRLLRERISFHQAGEARTFLEARRLEGQSGWEIASFDPLQTPVPLAALPWLRPVFLSNASAATMPALRIFEVVASE